MKDELVESVRQSALSRAAVIVWIALGLGLLTFCGGKTDDGQIEAAAAVTSSGKFAGTPVNGFAGHTRATCHKVAADTRGR